MFRGLGLREKLGSWEEPILLLPEPFPSLAAESVMVCWCVIRHLLITGREFYTNPPI